MRGAKRPEKQVAPKIENSISVFLHIVHRINLEYEVSKEKNRIPHPSGCLLCLFKHCNSAICIPNMHSIFLNLTMCYFNLLLRVHLLFLPNNFSKCTQ